MNVKFGICADLHTEFIHDSIYRMQKFFDNCAAAKVDFCVQLGDFCPPGETNIDDKNKILDMIKQYPRPFYHILGNHDMDENSKADVLGFIGQSTSHASFDCGGVHFVLIDACHYRIGDEYFDYDHGNYKSVPDGAEVPVLSPDELEWLRCDLARAQYPSVVFSHQSLIESRTGIRNPEDFRAVVRTAPHGVIMAVCGHEHIDRVESREGTWYVCINSMTYYWAGSDYDHTTYGEEIESRYPLTRCIFPYTEPLFATVHITDDAISICGSRAEYVGHTPKQMNFKKTGFTETVTSVIENRKLSLSNVSK